MYNANERREERDGEKEARVPKRKKDEGVGSDVYYDFDWTFLFIQRLRKSVFRSLFKGEDFLEGGGVTLEYFSYFFHYEVIVSFYFEITIFLRNYLNRSKNYNAIVIN